MGRKPYRCHYCGLGFMYKSSSKRHILKNICGYVTSEDVSENLSQKGKLFKCSKCGTNFLNKKIYFNHVHGKCNNGPSHHGLQKVSRLKKIIIPQDVSVSNGNQNEVGASCENVAAISENNDEMCIVCRKVFVTKIELEIHMKEHVTEKALASPIRVEKPVDPFGDQQQLRPDNFTCRDCGASVKSVKALKRHVLQHTGKIRCSVCDRAFGKLFLLKKHMKVHSRQGLHSNVSDSRNSEYCKSSSNQKFYRCKVCNKRFAKKCNLASHSRAHTELQPLAGYGIRGKETEESVGSEIAVYITEQPGEENSDFGSGNDFVVDEDNTQLTVDPLDHAPQSDEVTSFSTISDGEDSHCEMDNNSCQASDAIPSPQTVAQCIENFNPDLSFGELHVRDHTETSLYNQKLHIDTHAPIHSDHIHTIHSSDQVSESNTNSTTAEISCRSEHGQSGSNTELVHSRKKEVTVYITENEAVNEEFREFNIDDFGNRSESSVDPLQKDDDENDGLSLELDCTQCLKSFSSHEDLSNHVLSHKYHSKNSLRKRHNADHGSHPKYKCSVCWRDFLFDSDLVEHMKSHESNYTCSFCGKKFQTRNGLHTHFRLYRGLHHGSESYEEHGSDSMERLSTSEVIASSGLSFSSEEENIGHDSVDPDPIQLNDTCQVMDTGGTLGIVPPNIVRKNFYQKGKASNLTVSNAFTCGFCGSSFQNKAALVSHSKIHLGNRPYACDFCSQTFLSQSSLRVHQYKHRLYGHSNTKSGTAITSENATVSSSTLKQSSYILGSESPSNLHQEKFDIQGRNEVERQTLGEKISGSMKTLHIFSEQDSTNQCEFEGNSDKQINDADLADDCGNAESVTAFNSGLSCSVCGKTFKDKRGFAAHHRVHSGDRPFSCDVCSQNFLCLSSLRAHQSRSRHRNSERSTIMASENFTEVSSDQEKDREIDGRLPNSNEMERTSGSRAIFSMVSEQENTVPQQFSVSEKHRNNINVAGDHSDILRTVPQDNIERGADKIKSGLAFNCRSSCSICGKAFKTMGAFSAHLKVHSKNRPLSCNICGQRFLCISSLRSHQSRYKHRYRGSSNSVSGNTTRTSENSENLLKEGFGGIASRVLNSNEVEKTSGYREPFSITEENTAQYPSDSQTNDTNFEGDQYQNNKSRAIPQSNTEGFPNENEKESGFAFNCGLFCSICGKTFKAKGGLAAHLRVHTRNRPFSCDFCGQTFLSQTTLQRHLSVSKHKYYGQSPSKKEDITVSENDPKVSSLLQQSSYIPHSETSQNSNKGRDRSVERKVQNGLSCSICGKTVKNENGLKTHVQVHSGNRPFSCHMCSLKFATVNGLRTHRSKYKHRVSGQLKSKRRSTIMKSGNVTEVSSTVEQSSSTCNSVNSLNSHQEITGVSKNGIQNRSEVDRESAGNITSEYKETFSLTTEQDNTFRPVVAEVFDKHKNDTVPANDQSYDVPPSKVEKVMDQSGKKNACNVCSKTFQCKAALLSHLQVHSSNRPFACNFCREAFLSWSSCRRHLYKCKWKQGGHINNLNTQTLGEEEEQSLRKRCICPICRKQCKKPNGFVKHLKSHPGVDPYECNICNITFMDKKNLYLHEMKHSGIGKLQPDVKSSDEIPLSERGVKLNEYEASTSMLSTPLSSNNKITDSGHQSMETRASTSISATNDSVMYDQENMADDIECTNADSTEKINMYGIHSEKHMTGDESDQTNMCAENQPLSCTLCSMSFISIKAFMYHQDSHNSEGIEDTCTICKKKFDSRGSLAVHLRIHTQTRLFCGICNGVFLTKKMLKVHLKKHKKARLHTCNICQSTFSKYRVYIKHRKMHKFNCHRCQICDKKFASNGNLKRHIRAHSSIWDCPLCEVKNLRGGNFGLHMMRKHNIQRIDVDAYKTYAGDSSNELDSSGVIQERVDFDVKLREQQRGIADSPKIKEVYNEITSKDSGSPSSAVEVEEFQEKQDDIQCSRSQRKWKEMSNYCNICGLAFYTQTSFVKHARLHTSLDLKCIICETDFSDKAELEKHIDTHSEHQTNELPEKDYKCPYKCNICGKIMSHSQEFTSHLKLHITAGLSQEQSYDQSRGNITCTTNDMSHIRSYPCHKCKKVLPSYKCLRRHLQKHGKSKVFPCDVCGKQFKKKALLARHASVHSKNSFRGMCQVFLSGHDFKNSLLKSKSSLKNIYEGYIGEASTHEDTKNSTVSKLVTSSKVEDMIDGASAFVDFQIDEENSEVLKNKIADSVLKASGSINESWVLQDTEGKEKTVIKSSDKDGGGSVDNLCITQESFSSQKEAYVCSVCDKSFSRYQKLVSHEQIHFEPLLYDCDKCAKSFVNETEYDSHRKTHQKTAMLYYECPICDLKISNIANFTRHFESHGVSAAFLNIEDVVVSDSTAEIPKDIERTEVFDAVSVKRENNVEDSGNPKRSDSTSVKNKLEDNPSNVLTSSVEASLEGNSSKLEVHKKQHMDSSKKCYICGKVFSKRNRCKQHINKHSSKDYKCELCPKRFIRRIDFTSHRKDHEMTDEQNDLGDILCEAGKEQIVYVREKTVQATTHAETFVEALKDPLSDVHGFHKVIPSSKIQRSKIRSSDSEALISGINSCKKCNKSFSDYKSLLKHSALHMKKLQKMCVICKEEFINRGNMVQHMKVHNYCLPCEREFPSKKLFREHYIEHKRSSCALNKTLDSVTKKDNGVTVVCDQSALVSSVSSATVNDSHTNTSYTQLDVNAAFRKEADKFICNICNREIKQRKYLKRHMEVHSEYMPFKCTMCPKRTPSVTRLNRHMKTHSLTSRFSCKVCDQVFDCSSKLKRHAENIHNCELPELNDMAVESASEGRERESVAMRDSNIDVIEREQEDFLKDRYGDDWACFTCGKLFSNSDELRIHMLSNSCNKAHQCHICNLSFKNSENQKKHIKNVHSSNPDPGQLKSCFSDQREDADVPMELLSLCDSGNKAVESRENILQAVQTDEAVRLGVHSQRDDNTVKLKKHKKKKPMNVISQIYSSEGTSKTSQTGKYLTCPECGKVCIGQYKLDDHLISHSTDKPFKCTMCYTSFKRIFDMRRHMRNYHSFDPKSSTPDHMRKVVNISYKCPICYKTFLYDSFLKSHMLLHSRDKTQGDIGEEELYECAVERNDDDDMHELEPNVSETNIFSQEDVMVEDIAIDIKEEMIEGDIEDITIEDFNLFDDVLIEETGGTSQPFLSTIESKHTEYRKNRKGVQSKPRRDELFINNVERNESPSKKLERYGINSSSQDHFIENISSENVDLLRSKEGGLSSENTEFHATGNFKDTAGNGTGNLYDNTQKLASDTKNVHCKLCNVTYTSTLALLQHARLHSGLFSYQCDCCEMVFDKGRLYRNHFLVHVKEYIDCRHTIFAEIPVEDKPLPSSIPAYCRRRETVENATVNVKNKYQCIICGKTFTSERKLLGHKHVHYKLYYRACESCGKSFSSHEASRSHRFQHLTLVFPDASIQPLINSNTVTGELNSDLVTGQLTGDLVTGELNSDLVTEELNSDIVTGEFNSDIVTGEFNSDIVTGEFNSGKVTLELNSDAVTRELNSAKVTGELNSDTVTGELDSDTGAAELNSAKATGELNSDTVTGDLDSDTGTGELNSAIDTGELNSGIDAGELNRDPFTFELNSDMVTRELNSDAVTEELNSDTVTEELNSDTVTGGLTSDAVTGESNSEMVTGELNSGTVTGELNIDTTAGDGSRISNVLEQGTFTCSFCGKEFESFALCEEHKREHFDHVELDIGELASDSFIKLLGESVICNDES